MSQYSRNERNANAGLVVGIEPADFPLETAAWQAAFGEEDGGRLAAEAQALAQTHPPKIHPLAGIVMQRELESRAFAAGGASYEAPAQLVGDFLAGRPSTALGTVTPSYKPGIKLGDLANVLPAYAIAAMREALPVFGRKIRGYDMADAVLTGVETRTSAPLRITRNSDLSIDEEEADDLLETIEQELRRRERQAHGDLVHDVDAAREAVEPGPGQLHPQPRGV